MATRAEYKECLDTADQLVANQKAIRDRKANYDADVVKLQGEMEQHTAAGAGLGEKKGAIEAYNAKGATLNVRRDELSATSAKLQKDMAEHNRRGEESRAKCTGRRISREDREAVEKERAEQAKK
jgi:hypothetical protein